MYSNEAASRFLANVRPREPQAKCRKGLIKQPGMVGNVVPVDSNAVWRVIAQWITVGGAYASFGPGEV